MIRGFENERATFYVEEQVDVKEDAYNEDEPVFEWVPEYRSVDVRAEKQDAEYVREVYGEWPAEVYKLFVDATDIGGVVDKTVTSVTTSYPTTYSFQYSGSTTIEVFELGVSADDRVELAGVDGRFTMQPPTLKGFDSVVPEYVVIEVSRIGV